MRPAFLDTGYVIALEAVDDQHHREAQDHWHVFVRQQPRLITTSYVFDEVVTFFNSRDRHQKAVEIGRRLLQSPSVQMIHVDPVLFEAGWTFFCAHADKRYSLTDCISFVVMKEQGISDALCFDQHFEQAGFIRLPGRTS